MNRYFGELPTPLARSAAVESLHMERVALIFATGEMRVARLEVCPIPDSANVALSARLEQLTDNPRDGLLQYLTKRAVEEIQPDPKANEAGARLCLRLTPVHVA